MYVKINLFVLFLNNIYEFYNIINIKIKSYKYYIEFKY